MKRCISGLRTAVCDSQHPWSPVESWAAGAAGPGGGPQEGGAVVHDQEQVGPPSCQWCVEDWPQLLASLSWHHYFVCSLCDYSHLPFQKLKSLKWLNSGTRLLRLKIHEPSYSKSFSSTSLSFSYVSSTVCNGKFVQWQSLPLMHRPCFFVKLLFLLFSTFIMWPNSGFQAEFIIPGKTQHSRFFQHPYSWSLTRCHWISICLFL